LRLRLKDGDSLIAARFVGAQDEVSLITYNGQAIRFASSDVREMGRTAAGVTGMKLKKGDHIVSAEVLSAGETNREILIVTEDGFGKTTHAKEYKTQNRGGSGIKTAKVTSKTGPVVGAAVLSKEDRVEGELIVMSRKGR
jgi:DNA gyrase subunit A